MEADGNDRAFDTSSDKIWDRVNRGVCNTNGSLRVM